MLLNIYSVYDEKSEAFGIPFFVINDALALRNYDVLLNDDNSIVSKFPSDFKLYRIGVFNDVDSSIVSTIPPVLLSSTEMI